MDGEQQTAPTVEGCNLKSLATAMISGFLFQSAVLANEVFQILSVSNGQEVLIERNGEGRALRLACHQAPRSGQQPWADQAAASLRALVQPGDQLHFELRSRDVYADWWGAC